MAVLEGDGIGPEVTRVGLKVAEAAGLEVRWEHHPVGWAFWRAEGDALPAATLEACRAADAVFLGAVTSKGELEAEEELVSHLRGSGLRYVSPIVRLRRELDLRINVRPCVGQGLDVTIFRENTEGLYAGYEARPVPASLEALFPGLPVGDDAAVALRVVTRQAIEHTCRAAFRHAEQSGRRRVTLVEKPNVLRITGGLVREAFRSVAEDHPDITADELNVDAACALLVRDPGRFEVLVATNLFADILSDLAAELSGGLSLAASANLGGSHALFEPVHGSAPDIVGKGVANPVAAVRAVAMLARHLGQDEAASRIEAAVEAVLLDPSLGTPEMGGAATTQQVEAALLARLERPVPVR